MKVMTVNRQEEQAPAGKLLDIVTPLHKRTKRSYIDRMVDEKVHCMLKAKSMNLIIGTATAGMDTAAINMMAGGRSWRRR